MLVLWDNKQLLVQNVVVLILFNFLDRTRIPLKEKAEARANFSADFDKQELFLLKDNTKPHKCAVLYKRGVPFSRCHKIAVPKVGVLIISSHQALDKPVSFAQVSLLRKQHKLMHHQIS